MAHTYLTDVDFSGKATDDSCGAHIAYTFDFQGGAASGFNTPLLFKSSDTPEISFEKLEALEKMGEDITELRKSYLNQLMGLLGEAVRNKYESGCPVLLIFHKRLSKRGLNQSNANAHALYTHRQHIAKNRCHILMLIG